MEHEDRHLRLEELVSLFDIDHIDSGAGIPLSSDMQRHIENCRACGQLIRELERSGIALNALRIGASGPGSSPCLSEASLTELACGVLAPEQAISVVTHVIECPSCGAAFREITETLCDDLTGQERAFISTLGISQLDRQQRLAKDLKRIAMPAGPGVRKKSEFRMRLWLPMAAAAMVGVIVLAIWSYRYSREPNPDSLIAQAYAEHRTFDLRFQNARFGQISRQREAGGSVLAKPEPLLRAELSVKDQLTAKPHDPNLLDAKARIELIEWQYDDAIQTLNAALNERPHWPAALSDLAIAYTQRGDQESRPLDYGTAIDLLGQAMAQEPNNPVLLFNEAILDEKLNLLQSANDNWERYLKVDPTGEWAAEARERLKKVQDKLSGGHSGLRANPDPVRAVADLNAAVQTAKENSEWRNSREEDYLDVAIRIWLPSLAKQRLGHQDVLGTAEWPALNSLARILALQHGDEWLLDMISDTPSDQVARGWIRLGASAVANDQGDFSKAATLSVAAEDVFSNGASSDAALLLALWEHAYAMQRSQDGAACLRDTGRANEFITAHRYPWIYSELLFERGICAGMLADMRRPRELIEHGIALAGSAGYPNELLRGYHLRGIQSAAQDPSDAWKWFAKGLRQHWNGPYRPFRVYHFYAEMAITAENRDQWHLARALMSEAVTHITRTDNQLTTAIAMQMLATDTQMAGFPDRALAILRRAGQMFSSLPRSPAADNLRASVAVEQASILCQQRHCENALDLLRSAEPYLHDQTQYRIWLQYYGTLGEALLQTGDSHAAEKALMAAIQLSEQVLQSIRDDNDRIQWERLTQRPYRDLVKLELDDTHDAALALDIWNWYKAAAIRSISVRPRTEFSLYSSTPLTPPSALNQIRHFRIRNVTFLSFAELDGEMIGWIYDEHGIDEVRLRASPVEVRAATDRFRSLCADPRSDLYELRRLGAQLFQWLIVPFADHLDQTRTIAIGPDGGLQDIAFAALVTQDGGYFGQEYTLIDCSGVDFWSQLRAHGRFAASDRALAVAFPYGASDNRFSTPFLPEAYTEATEVSRHFTNTQVLLGRDANLESLGRELRGVRVLHFAGHSVITDTTSALLIEEKQGADHMSRSQLLDAVQIQRLPMQTVDLAVLSACSSAGRDSGDGSPYPLVRPFVRLGVPDVIASRWQVDSEVTADFMDRFYDGLLAEASPALALKHAYKAIAAKPATAHPYYWAAFSVFGR